MNDDKNDKKELTLADLQNVRGAALAGGKKVTQRFEVTCNDGKGKQSYETYAG
jgi:hypothetical protein